MEGSGKALHAMARSAAAARVTGRAPAPASARDRVSRSSHMVSITTSSTDARTRALAAASREPTTPLHDQCGRSTVEGEMEEGRYRRVFGPTPSQAEVTEAITTIRQIFPSVTFSRIFEDGSSSASSKDVIVRSEITSDEMYGISPSVSQSENIEPESKLYNAETIESQKVIDAFRSLHINPSIQRMVTSLSSDKDVWDAVMQNEAVKELRKSFYGVEQTKMKKVDSCSNVVEIILDWILGLVKAKILEVLDQIWRIGNAVFNHQDTVNASLKGNNSLGDAVRSSFILTVVVFMVVVVLRL